MIIQQSNLML